MEIEESTKGGDEWQVHQKSKNKSKVQNLIGKTSTLMSIMRTGSNYVHSRRGRGRGGSSAVNRRQVQYLEKSTRVVEQEEYIRSLSRLAQE